jgi:hypothetical protein
MRGTPAASKSACMERHQVRFSSKRIKSIMNRKKKSQILQFMCSTIRCQGEMAFNRPSPSFRTCQNSQARAIQAKLSRRYMADRMHESRQRTSILDSVPNSNHNLRLRTILPMNTQRARHHSSRGHMPRSSAGCRTDIGHKLEVGPQTKTSFTDLLRTSHSKRENTIVIILTKVPVLLILDLTEKGSASRFEQTNFEMVPSH